MGSLPNLHELEAAERKREKRREYELLLEQRARDTSRERERLSLFAQQRKQSSYNAYVMAGLGVGGGSLSLSTAGAGNADLPIANGGGPVQSEAMGCTTTTTTTATTTTSTFSGFTMLGLTTKRITSHSHHQNVPPQQNQHQHLHQHQHHHRHSLTTRHRVLRTRSSGGAHNVWDDQMMEAHFAAYSPSPVSTRSHRINPVSSYQVQAALAASRRRESINSSIGATSIRRLITLNSRSCRHRVPAHVRQKVWRQFSYLAIAHGLMNAVLLPMMALQGSNAVWHHREQWLPIGPDIGSLLLSTLFLLAAGMCLPSAWLMRRYGYTPLLAANYLAVMLFVLSHIYASIYTLLPAYLLLGLTISGANGCKAALIVHFGGRLSCSQAACEQQAQAAVDVLNEEHKMFCNREQKVRRLARWFRASQDLGLIVGALLASVLLVCNGSDWSCSGAGDTRNGSVTAPQLRDFFNRNEHGERICGADMCPLRVQTPLVADWANGSGSSFTQRSIYVGFIESGARAGGQSLLWLYVLFSLVSLILSLVAVVGRAHGAAFMGSSRQERSLGLRDVSITDTLLFAGPLAYFVGTEQAYMLGDFLRAFVSCSLGIGMIAGAMVGMGLMQLIVSCTLSMLLRHVKRIVVILAGFFFHSCLLLALSSWKPSNDDSALFYVIAASWGACNGMWETLLLSLVTLNHANHVTEVSAPLQALRFLGLGITFAGHGFLCESLKIIALVVLLVISVPPYATLEIRLEAQRKATLISL
ncbi:protein unc-93 homolog A [Drosophila pseudoobscura]|uniref:Protein unc-93 homolog A n=1 Tax=Drosophila pseudoobscura pseudoobscura TaxID=46245 RepID=A0A6I8UGS0_DROPS|nr:protein unc-93 homolog A [Drosophila pseudoobscura]XP_033240076.1 protein unc-93 homolog A [Drosophila pseudoobscura]XP_033240077.1 protein unc-93 homolog A [Drosophila pseudoobscura]